MNIAEKLSAYTPVQGALFPFSVDQPTSLDDWEPRPLTIAVTEKEYRIDTSQGEKTKRELERIVSEIAGDELSQWKPSKPKQIKKSQKPESD